MKTFRLGAVALGFLLLTGLLLHRPAEALEPCMILTTEDLSLQVEWLQRDGADAGSLAGVVPAPLLSASVGHADAPRFLGLSEGLAGTATPETLAEVP